MDSTTLWHFLTVFGVIFVGELPDKTAFASIIMASQRPALPVFLGACLAFMVHAIIAVACGSLLALMPAKWVHVGAGVLFLVFAVVMWRKAGGEEEVEGTAGGEPTFWKTLASAFGVIFVAEWGDLTQLAMAAMAAQYHSPLMVFTASTLALWAVAGIGVVLGARLKHAISPATLQRVAAVAFALVGVWMLVAGLRGSD